MSKGSKKHRKGKPPSTIRLLEPRDVNGDDTKESNVSVAQSLPSASVNATTNNPKESMANNWEINSSPSSSESASTADGMRQRNVQRHASSPKPTILNSQQTNGRSLSFGQIPGVNTLQSFEDGYQDDEDEQDDGLPAFLEQQQVKNEGIGPAFVPRIKTFDLDSASCTHLSEYIEEEAPTHHYPHTRPLSLHSLSQASPSSSLLTMTIPRSKSLQLGRHASVLQAVPSTKTEVVEVVAEQSWLITKLTVQLLWALRMSKRWIGCTIRLIWFVVLLLPAFLHMCYYWLTDEHVHKNIIYGLKGRNLLDVYTVPAVRKLSASERQFARHPVVVFLSGGAWIIGYKSWGALMGKVLSSFGIVVVTPDYRNFPQGIVPDMIEDSSMAMQWVFDNIHLFGGDPENVTLIGQSAGAHIAICALLELVEKREHELAQPPPPPVCSPPSALSSPTFSTSSAISNASSMLVQPPSWGLKQVRTVIGISGPYNIEACVEAFHRHGFEKGVVERIMDQRLAYYSPTLRFFAKSERANVHELLHDFPPVFLCHGTADKTVSWKSTQQFTHALESCGIPVATEYFDNKTHTDPIIEDPICGDDFLLEHIIAIIKDRSPRDADGDTTFEFGEFKPKKRYYPSLLMYLARKVNPF